jgi:hypothetical protein
MFREQYAQPNKCFSCGRQEIQPFDYAQGGEPVEPQDFMRSLSCLGDGYNLFCRQYQKHNADRFLASEQ